VTTRPTEIGSDGPPSKADRRVGAVANLGIPLYIVVCPLLVWAVSTGKPFRRAHACQAFSFQCVVLVAWIVLIALVVFGVISPLVLLGYLGVGLILELPQVVRCLHGSQPIRLIPIEVLPK
jgi:uncharacterized Tic20 family protein